MLAIVFDPHCWPHKRFGGELKHGINRRGQLTLQTLNRAVAVANEHDAELVVAGDLVDSAGPVQPQFAVRLRDELARCRGSVSLLLGNHDMTADEDHSLGIYETEQVKAYADLVWSDYIRGYGSTMYDKPSEYSEFCLVPFHRNIRDERVRDVPLLVGHFGVFDDSFPPWAQRSKGAWHVDRLFEFMKERNVRVCMLGDWHQRKLWSEVEAPPPHNFSRAWHSFASCGSYEGWSVQDGDYLILQGGALNPTGFDNSGLHGYGTIALWDGERLSWQELPGPRFCTVHSDEEEAATIAEATQLGHNLFLRRFYQGKRPQRPSGVEAYEALPQAIESAARKAVQETTRARLGMEAQAITRLIHEWIRQIERTDGLEYAEAVEQLIKEYT